MATPDSTGAPSRPSDNFPTTDEHFEAVVREAGENPELAAELAQGLGFGRAPSPPINLLSAVLAGAEPPPSDDCAEFEPEMRPGAVDTSLARAADHLNQDRQLYETIRAELLGSMRFARHVGLLTSALRHGAAPEDLEQIVIEIFVNVFRGGFLAAADACNVKDIVQTVSAARPVVVPTSPLMLALKNGVLMPFDPELSNYGEIPEGAFDAGLAKVMAEEERSKHARPPYAAQIANSGMFARAVTQMVACLHDDTPQETAQSIVLMARRVFRAGWMGGYECAELESDQAAARARESGDLTTDWLNALLVSLDEAPNEHTKIAAISTAVEGSTEFGRLWGVICEGLQEEGWQRPTEQNAGRLNIDLFAARLIRTGYLAAQTGAPVSVPTRMGELLDLFRRKIHLGAINDDALTSGGCLGKKPYWTQKHIDMARRIVRLEYAPEDHAAYYAQQDAEAEKGGVR